MPHKRHATPCVLRIGWCQSCEQVRIVIGRSVEMHESCGPLDCLSYISAKSSGSCVKQ